MLEVSESSVIYQAKTELLRLAYEVASTRNYKKPEAQVKIDKGFGIYKSLQALDFEIYLTQTQRQRIVYCLIKQAGINDFPVAPVLGNTTPPTIQVGIPGPTGLPGQRGDNGGAVDFSALNQGTDCVADSFAVTEARAARWDYVLYDSGTNRRSGSVICDWSADGSSVTSSAEYESSGNGSTSTVNFSVDFFGGNIRLIATITGGTWNIKGSRYFIPNNGTGTGTINTSLQDGYIFVGNASNIATAVLPSGVITMTDAGVFSIVPASIVNANIAVSTIAPNKITALTINKALITDGSGYMATATVSATELNYLVGATSNIQTQLDSKIGSVTGAISTVVSSDLTVSRAVVSNPSGKIAVSTTTSTEIGFLSGVTSAIQTQITGRVDRNGDTMAGALSNSSTIEARGGIRTSSSGPYFKIVEIDFSWVPAAASSISIAHGVDSTKIISVSGIIYSLDGHWAPIASYLGSSLLDSPMVGFGAGDATSIVIRRTDSGDFAGGVWSSVTGRIIILLIA